MSTWTVWALVALGAGSAVVRRRSMATVLVALQTAGVGVVAAALAPDRGPEFAVAAAILCAKAAVVAPLLAWAVARTREARPVRDDASPLVRLAVVAGLILALAGLLPAFGLDPAAAENGAAAMVATGLALIVVRRASIFQLLALLVAENGIAVAAVSVPGGMPVVVELGVAFDVVLLALVAVAFHDRIFRSLGTTDTAALGELRD